MAGLSLKIIRRPLWLLTVCIGPVQLGACVTAATRSQGIESKGETLSGTTPAEHETLTKTLNKRYSPEDFIVSWGSGPTAVAALNEAKAEISNRINSQVTATSISRRSLMTGPLVAEPSRSELSIEVSSTSIFKHADLIRESHGSRHLFDGAVYVFASLKKVDIAGVLGREYEMAAIPFRRICTRIIDAGNANDRRAICSQKQEFEVATASVNGLADQWFSIFSRYPERYATDSQCRTQAAKALAVISMPRLLTVDAAALDARAQGPVVDAIRGAVAKSGFTLSEGKDCTVGIFLRLKGKAFCSPGSLGAICQMNPAGEMQECTASRRRLGNVNLGRASGISPSGDAAAMNRLVASLKEINLKDLSKRLENEIAPCGVGRRENNEQVAH